MSKLKVLLASSEVEPFAKTGGLADVAGSLPKAFHKIGDDVRVVMPKYKNIPQRYLESMEYVGYVYVDVGWRHQYCGIFKLDYNGVIVYFLDNEQYFGREGLYGYNDDGERFTFFSKAVLQMLPCIDFKPDILHCNDWQTGILSLILHAHYKHLDFYKDIKTVYTVHNLKYQGVFPKEMMELLNIDWEHFTVNGIEFYDKVNFLKAGLLYSDILTTVSPTYAEEIKTDFYGENLSETIKKRADSLYGIVNGIDMEGNDPANDSRLFRNYDSDNLDGKYDNKINLQQSLGLPTRNDIPLIGIISRMVPQKGFDLISFVLDDILRMDLQVVILGAGEQHYEHLFSNAAHHHPTKLSVNLKYDPVLAQRIYAGSDMFLMPSLFEPCGLSQLFSLRYGSIPIVRETGGLKDTIQPLNELTGQGNGFTFTRYNAHDMLFAIKEAVHVYHHRSIWQNLVKRGMNQDFSWSKSAYQYRDLYKKLKT
ncbi:MAG: glycogen synthase GlgA [Clostridia bacterium]|nr:glycogen synthase GlgA [Clostridia bacterium]